MDKATKLNENSVKFQCRYVIYFAGAAAMSMVNHIFWDYNNDTDLFDVKREVGITAPACWTLLVLL